MVLAAAEALAHMQHAKAAPDLIALLKTAPPEAAGRVAGILGWTIDEKGLDPLAASLDTLQPAARAAAIGLIGDKSGKRFAASDHPADRRCQPRDPRGRVQGASPASSGPTTCPTLLTLLDEGRTSRRPAAAPATARGLRTSSEPSSRRRAR